MTDNETREHFSAQGRAMVDELMASAGPDFDDPMRMLHAITAQYNAVIQTCQEYIEAIKNEEIQ